MNPIEAQPAVRYHAALLIRAGSWIQVLGTLEAAGAVIEETPPTAGRIGRYAVSMPEPKKPDPRSTEKFLGKREMEMLERLARGMSVKQIAVDLVLSYNTVKTHIRSLFRKLGVGDKAHAVAIGYQRGLLGGE